ncbi:MAG TPA: signal peptidase II [Gallionellaceae bacterium]|nr:signal peptidase II [Gallionellaceae bacterium]
MPEQRGYWRWLGLAGLVIVLDQLSKYAVLAHFTPGESKPITFFFDLTLAFNQGAAFSFLHNAGGWQRWLLSALAIGASVWIAWWLRRHGGTKLFRLALALIMGGALGNVVDRFTHDGAVVDFLDFHLPRPYELNLLGYHWALNHFPAFNLADSAITCGAALLLLEALIEHRKTRRARTASPGA